MSWAAVAASAISAGVGIYQTQKAKKLAEQAGERPDYEIPEAMKSALGTSQLKSLQGMPGAVKSEMLQEMDRSRMASLRQVNERRGGLGVVSQLDQTQQDSIRQMGIMDIQQREKNVQGLQDMRMKMAGYQEKQQADTLASWEQQSQAAAAMKGAGMQNIMGAVQGGAMAAGQGLQKRAQNKTSYKEWKATTQQGADPDSIPSFGEWKKEGGLERWNVGQRQQQQFQGFAGVNQNLAPPNQNINTTTSNEKINTSNLSSTSKNMGLGGGLGYNEGMTSNIALSSGLNKFEQNNPPSLQNQIFGANYNNQSHMQMMQENAPNTQINTGQQKVWDAQSGMFVWR